MLMLALSKPSLVNKINATSRTHGVTLCATFFTRRSYTDATFRATLRAIFDERLSSSHAIMFTSHDPKERR